MEGQLSENSVAAREVFLVGIVAWVITIWRLSDFGEDELMVSQGYPSEDI